MLGLFARLLLQLRFASRATAFAVALLSLSVAAGCGRSGFEDSVSGSTDLDTGVADVPPGDVPPDSFTDVPIPPDGTALDRVVVEPTAVAIAVGLSTPLQAFAVYTDGSKADVTGIAVWSSEAPSVASVVGGVVNGITGGTAVIRASFSGKTGTASVTVKAITLTELRIDPPTASIPVGGTATFTATGVFSDGSSSDVTSSATWTTDAPGIATVTAGVAIGVGAGGTGVTATLAGKSATAKLTVIAGKTVKSVEISPTSPILGLGVSQDMQATALFTDGSTADVTTTASWVMADPSIASLVVGTTKVTIKGAKAGTTTLSATFSGVTGNTSVKVTAASLTGVAVSPSTATTGIGGTIVLTATANYSDGSSVDVTASALWSTGDSTIATVASGVVKGVAVGTAKITATFSTASGSASITVSPLKLLSIAITPADSSAPLGSKPALKATGTYEGGVVRDITSDVVWSTDDATIATVSNATGTKGTVSPLALGKTTVRAKLDGIEGSTTVTVTSASLTSIAITPNPVSIVAGLKQFMKATATYSDGSTVDVTTTCTWSTASGAVATVSNATGAQGLLAAVAAGTTTVSCVQSGVTGSATVTVTGATLDSVVVAPINPTCRVGDILFFNATAISSAGTSTNVTGFSTWSSSDTSVVSATGGPGPVSRFRCNKKGVATISATYLGKTGTTKVTVTDAVVTSIVVDPAALSLAVGSTQQYQATAIYSDGTSVNVTGAATWVSTSPTVAAIGDAGFNKGRLQTLAAGTTNIRATYSGITGSTTLTVTSAVITAIQISPPAPSGPTGITFQFQATAVYSDGTSRNVTGLATWVSSAPTIVSVGDAGPVKGQAKTLTAGVATVSAIYGGLTGKATVTVTTAKLTAVQVTPFKPTLPVGYGVRLTATAVWDDGFTLNVTGQSTWTTSNAAVAVVADGFGSKGRVTPIAAGTAKISAQYVGVVGTADVTVSSATLSSIAISPSAPTVAVSGNQQLIATGTFSDGTTLDITEYVGWASSDTSKADVSNATDTKGIAYGFSAGTVTVTATKGTVVGKDTLTIK